MKKLKTYGLTLMAVALVAMAASGVRAEEMSATAILSKADDVANAPKDSAQTVQLLLVDKAGQQKERKMETLQKGSEKRMIKFLAPADQKGIGFLSLPNDVMYLYLPAFKKTRRIASHIKNTKFAGTDFTYEDLEAKRFGDKWNPTLVKSDAQSYVLQLALKPETKSDYSKLIMNVNKSNFVVTKMEMYDKSGKLFKVLTREKVEQINGYWTPKDMLMDDQKEQHKTRMILQDVKFDQGLADSKFSERYLAE